MLEIEVMETVTVICGFYFISYYDYDHKINPPAPLPDCDYAQESAAIMKNPSHIELMSLMYILCHKNRHRMYIRDIIILDSFRGCSIRR